jgi:hypothetical protein
MSLVLRNQRLKVAFFARERLDEPLQFLVRRLTLSYFSCETGAQAVKVLFHQIPSFDVRRAI